MNNLVTRLNKAIERLDKATKALCQADEEVLLAEMREFYEPMEALTEEARKALIEFRDADSEYHAALEAVEDYEAEQDRKNSWDDSDNF